MRQSQHRTAVSCSPRKKLTFYASSSMISFFFFTLLTVDGVTWIVALEKSK